MFKENTCVFFPLIALAFLMACGGSAPVSVPAPTVETENASFSQAQALLDTHADPVIYAELSNVPTSGSATYIGLAYGDLANPNDTITDSLIGDLTLSTDFGASNTTFSGEIENLLDDNGNSLNGSLLLGSGSFDRSGSPTSDPTIGISVSGSLTDSDGRTLEISARLEGDFLGSTYEAVGGEFLGSMTQSSQRQDLDGGFIAER